MENKRKHLDFIQDVINRMARNSFLIKGWCITIVAALFALAAKQDNSNYIIITIIPLLMFWILDGYFLYQERLYRALYDEVRVKEDKQIDYSMNAINFAGGKKTWVCSMFSKTLNIFYLFLFGMVFGLYFFLNFYLLKT